MLRFLSIEVSDELDSESGPLANGRIGGLFLGAWMTRRVWSVNESLRDETSTERKV